MKRFFSLTLLACTLALTACAGLDVGSLADPIVRVAETVTDDSTSTKGITTGMSSSDARDVLINREYYGAIRSINGAAKGATPAAQPMLVDIEAHDGQPITINAKRFKVYAPPAPASAAQQLAITPPAVKKSAWKEFSEEARGWFRDAVVPWKSLDEAGQTRRLEIVTNGEIRQSELGVINNAVTGSQNLAGQAITTFAPVVIETPAAPATTP
jgi:hypothetical protein